jgi:hypothetical protein
MRSDSNLFQLPSRHILVSFTFDREAIPRGVRIVGSPGAHEIPLQFVPPLPRNGRWRNQTSEIHHLIHWQPTAMKALRYVVAALLALVAIHLRVEMVTFVGIFGYPSDPKRSDGTSKTKDTLEESLLMYLVSTDDAFQRDRIAELQRVFSGKFYVVWDRASQPECPFRDIANCLDFDGELSSLPRFSNKGRGQEKAVMWSIAHRHTFRYVWLMEEDVHYTDVSHLVHALSTESQADLLFHGPNQELLKVTDEWFHAKTVRNQSAAVFRGTPLYRKMLNLFRMSSSLLFALEKVYVANSKQWIFFETLIPTAVYHFNLTSEDWTEQEPSAYNFRYRPCYTEFPTGGIYHPAKFRSGTPRTC